MGRKRTVHREMNYDHKAKECRDYPLQGPQLGFPIGCNSTDSQENGACGKGIVLHRWKIWLKVQDD